jgi:hypothetical protein
MHLNFFTKPTGNIKTGSGIHHRKTNNPVPLNHSALVNTGHHAKNRGGAAVKHSEILGIINYPGGIAITPTYLNGDFIYKHEGMSHAMPDAGRVGAELNQFELRY